MDLAIRYDTLLVSKFLCRGARKEVACEAPGYFSATVDRQDKILHAERAIRGILLWPSSDFRERIALKPYVCNSFVTPERQEYVYGAGLAIYDAKRKTIEYCDPLCIWPFASKNWQVILADLYEKTWKVKLIEDKDLDPEFQNLKLAYLLNKVRSPSFSDRHPTFRSFVKSLPSDPTTSPILKDASEEWLQAVKEDARVRQATKEQASRELEHLIKEFQERIEDGVLAADLAVVPEFELGSPWQMTKALEFLSKRHPDSCVCMIGGQKACARLYVRYAVEGDALKVMRRIDFHGEDISYHCSRGGSKCRFFLSGQPYAGKREFWRHLKMARELERCGFRIFASSITIVSTNLRKQAFASHVTGVVFDKKLMTVQYFDSEQPTEEMDAFTIEFFSTFFPEYRLVSFEPGCPRDKSFFPQTHLKSNHELSQERIAKLWTHSCSLWMLVGVYLDSP